MAGKILYILRRFRNRRNRTYARCTPAGKILYILQRFRNRRNRNYARCTTAGKILYILQRFRNPRHQNCDSCTMAETFRIYYSGIVDHSPLHLRRRKTYSGEDVMLAGKNRSLVVTKNSQRKVATRSSIFR